MTGPGRGREDGAGSGEFDAHDVVDVHAHGVPRKLLEDVRTGKVHCPGVTVSGGDGHTVLAFEGGAPPFAISAALLDFEERLSWLESRAIGTQLISPWLDVQGSTLPVEAGQRWTMLLNEYLAEQVRDAGGRLHALASVHLGDPSRAAAELERAINELGFCGLVLSTDPVPAELSADEVDELWATAADLRIPVVLHPDVCGPASSIYEHDDVGHINAFARVVDTTLLAVRLVQRGVLDRHSDLNLVLVHGGGFLPFQSTRIQRALEIDSLGPNLAQERDLGHYLRRFYYDTVLMSRGAVEMLVEEFGAEHVVLGSDYPFAIGDPDPVGTVTRTRISDGEKQKILGANAHTLFGPLPATIADGRLTMYVSLAAESDLAPTLERLARSGRPGVDATFIRSLSHASAAERFFPFYYDLWFENRLGPRLTELVRLAIANTTGCPLCLAGRIPEATLAGVTEEDIAAVTAPEAGEFSERERAALRYAYRFGSDHHSIGRADFEALHEHFDDEELAELGMLCALFLGFGRLVKVLELVDPVCVLHAADQGPGSETHATGADV